jgi:hypothetical protein
MSLFAALLAYGLLYLYSLESAQNWPNLAHLRLPIYGATLVGAIPFTGAIVLGFKFSREVDLGNVFSTYTIQILRQIRLLIGVFAGYLALAIAGFWVATGLMHPTILFAWFVAEISTLLLFTLVALSERTLAVALDRLEANRVDGQTLVDHHQSELNPGIARGTAP